MNAKTNSPSLPLTSTGKEIRVLPAVEPQLKLLKAAARQGFYYPMLALKQLESLSAGPLGKHNVFIPDINHSKAHTLQLFYIYLPGIKATIERRANDTYMVTALELSDGYARIGKGAHKPGIYAISKKGENSYQASYKNNNRITAKDNRVVVICDGGYSNPEVAAADAAEKLMKTPGQQAALRGDFDIMYPSIENRLGGMRNYDPKTITKGFAAASVLANAMIQSQKTDGVLWVSTFGGSSVFTQAMCIVSQNKVRLPNHIASMYQPRTSVAEATQVAQQIGFVMDKNFAKGGVMAYLNSMSYNMKRVRNTNDPYSLKDYAKDIATGGITANTLIGAGLFVPALYLTSAATAATIASGIGAAHVLWTSSRNLFEKPKR